MVDSEAMTNQSSVLVLDDGELGNVYRMLLKLGTDVVRLQGPEIGRSVPAPRDLLISAGRRTLREMPELIPSEHAPNSPIWVCVHNQDFLPMRERLCEMGVHYLLQNALDEQSRQRFLIQLLRKGAEQRGSLRLHLGGDIRYRTDTATAPGRLVELSLEGCRILTQEPFDPGTLLTALLPPALGGGDELELTGAVLRAADHELRGGHDNYATVIQFDELDGAKREQLEGIIRGERIGTKITPLASLPEQVDCGEEDQETGTNRRAEVRHGYDGPARVLGCGPADADPVLGCDLSLSGVRLSGCQGLANGTAVTIALFGAAREEPTVLEATVVRTSQDGEVALAFDRVSAKDQQALEKLLRSRPVLDALHRPDPDAGRTIVAEIRRAASA
jgi:hypothetical protein